MYSLLSLLLGNLNNFIFRPKKFTTNPQHERINSRIMNIYINEFQVPLHAGPRIVSNYFFFSKFDFNFGTIFLWSKLYHGQIHISKLSAAYFTAISMIQLYKSNILSQIGKNSEILPTFAMGCQMIPVCNLVF